MFERRDGGSQQTSPVELGETLGIGPRYLSGVEYVIRETSPAATPSVRFTPHM